MSESLVKNARILIVDDQAANIRLIERILQPAGYTNLRSIQDPREVVGLFLEFHPDLILLDLHMPHLDGFGVMGQLAPYIPAGDFIPILVLTADILPVTKQRVLSMGAKDFLTKPFDVIEVLLRIRNLLESRFLHVELQAQNQKLDAKVAERTQELELAQYEMLDRLARASESRDDDTGHHTQRVGKLSAALAESAGQSSEQCSLIGRAAALHDIGKIGIPDSILLKPGRLTPEEFECIKTHTTIGARILSGSRFPLIHAAEEVALNHHEKWDGTGYFGLGKEEIPLMARIVTIADVYDVLTHSRPYKEAWPAEQALAEIDSQSGRAFDPRLVEVFRNNLWQQDLSNLNNVVGGEPELVASPVGAATGISTWGRER